MVKHQIITAILKAAIAMMLPVFNSGQTEFIPMETEFEETTAAVDTVLEIGSLSISLPKGWRVEKRTDEEGREQCILTDVHSEYADEKIRAHTEGYEHEIVIMPYEMRTPPESPLGVIGEIRAYFSVPALWSSIETETMDELMGTVLWGSDREKEQSEYFIISGNETGGIELFHIREDASSLTTVGNDIEAFWELIDEYRVRASHRTLEYTRFTEWQYYYSLNMASGEPMLMSAGKGPDKNQVTVSTYRMGKWKEPLSEQILPLNDDYNLTDLMIADMNGDGWEDFGNISGDKVVMLPDGFGYEEARHPYSGGIWDEDKHEFDYAEWDILPWEEGEASVLMTEHPEELIPQGLTEYLSEYLLKSREEIAAVMLPLVSDRNLTEEEVKALAEENDCIRRERQRVLASPFGEAIWLMVDGDNDGIEDIFMCDYLGGSGGPMYCHFFKGNSEGGYEHTDEYSIFKEEFGFLSFEGQNYLAQTTWDFGKKVYDGIRLTCYLEGIFQGGVVLKIVPKQGEEIESFKIDYLKEEKLQALVEGLQKFSDNYVINREVLAGSAEQVNVDEKYNRAGDIDNDGIKEQYHLFMGYTTNYYTVDGMVFKAQEEELADTVYNLISEEIGNFMGMWVDETEFGNVTYLLYEEGLYDFYVSGYLFSRENDRWESQKLIQVTCKVQTEVITEPYHPYTTN